MQSQDTILGSSCNFALFLRNSEGKINNTASSPKSQLSLLPLCFVKNLDKSLWNTVMVNEVLRKVINDSTLNQDLVLPLLT